jgi:SWI/SNF-related matrix-associated actin-dependent regulator of chromatin subfamily A3
MDPWWQSAIELQAIDRVNRIGKLPYGFIGNFMAHFIPLGQTKNVHVYQMVADDTVETRVLAIQERKKQLIEQVGNIVWRSSTPCPNYKPF